MKVASIGEGRFGKLSIGYYKKLKLSIAIKTVSSMSCDEVMREAQITSYLSEHPCFPVCFGMINDYQIALQLIGNINSSGILVDARSLNKCYGDLLLQPEWIKVTKQLIDAISFMHSKKVLHNDLKSNNIMIDLMQVHLYVIDFGKANLVSCPNTYNIKAGSKKHSLYNNKYRYLATELRNIPGSKQSFFTDIYSLGYIIKYIGYYQSIKSLFQLGVEMADNEPLKRPSLRYCAQYVLDLPIKQYSYDFCIVQNYKNTNCKTV